MINLVLTEKQAVALHMVYYVGAMVIAGDDPLMILHMSRNVGSCLAANFTDEERDELKRMISNVGCSIDPATLAAMRIRLFE